MKIKKNQVVGLDFETYWDKDYTLSKLSTSEYIRDPRFAIHGVSIKRGGRKTEFFAYEQVEPALRAIDWKNAYLLCHHTHFDGFILHEHFGIHPKFYLDTLSMARGLYRGLPNDLDSLAQRLGHGGKIQGLEIKTKGIKRVEGDDLVWLAAYANNDVDKMWLCFWDMLKVFPEDELEIIDLAVRMFCRPLLQVDIERAQKEHRRELREKQKLIKQCKVTKDILLSNEKFAQKLIELGVDPPVKFSERTGRQTWAFSKQDLDFLELTEHSDWRVRSLVEARLTVKSTGNETKALRLIKRGENGKPLPLYYTYCGAHTTRYSGGDGLNPQNFARGGELRKSIIAPKGHVIIVADSGQIECRGVNWFAGQEDVLDIFRAYDAGKGPDLYRVMAADIYGVLVENVTDEQRFIGKISELGLGYQMGAAKLQNMLATGAFGQAVFLDLYECRRIVNMYRRRHYKVAQLWERADQLLRLMLRGGRGVFMDLFEYEPDRIWLPNGLALFYYDLSINENDELSYHNGRSRTKIYGGKLVENLVQAFCRVIVFEQKRRIAKELPVVMSTHDEIAVLAPEREADKALEFMVTEMQKPLSWCKDLPLSAEGKYAPYYCK